MRTVYAELYAERSRDQIACYARAAAELQALSIREEWWPAVLRHLTILLGQSDLVAVGPGGREATPPGPDAAAE
jgi:hypothetical protein